MCGETPRPRQPPVLPVHCCVPASRGRAFAAAAARRGRKRSASKAARTVLRAWPWHAAGWPLAERRHMPRATRAATGGHRRAAAEGSRQPHMKAA
eukprot:364538-Chlamydomonas_euryale.AAC.2